MSINILSLRDLCFRNVLFLLKKYKGVNYIGDLILQCEQQHPISKCLTKTRNEKGFLKNLMPYFQRVVWNEPIKGEYNLIKYEYFSNMNYDYGIDIQQKAYISYNISLHFVISSILSYNKPQRKMRRLNYKCSSLFYSLFDKLPIYFYCGGIQGFEYNKFTNEISMQVNISIPYYLYHKERYNNKEYGFVELPGFRNKKHQIITKDIIEESIKILLRIFEGLVFNKKSQS